MIRSGEEILADIDTTLDQLIQNAEVIRYDYLCENEIEALQKTQESLLARLIHMDLLLDSEQKKIPAKKKPLMYSSINQKLERFGKLNIRLINNVAHRFADPKKTRVRKNRRMKTLKAN